MPEPSLADPRDAINCACPRIDPRDCVAVRDGCIGGALHYEERHGQEPESCECSCHDTDPDDEYDIDAMRDAAAAS